VNHRIGQANNNNNNKDIDNDDIDVDLDDSNNSEQSFSSVVGAQLEDGTVHPGDALLYACGPWTANNMYGTKYHSIVVPTTEKLNQCVFFSGLGDPEVYVRGDNTAYCTGFPDPPIKVVESPGEEEIRQEAIDRIRTSVEMASSYSDDDNIKENYLIFPPLASEIDNDNDNNDDNNNGENGGKGEGTKLSFDFMKSKPSKISDLQFPLTLILVSSCILLIAVATWENVDDFSSRGYALAIPSLSLSFSLIGFLLAQFREDLYQIYGKYLAHFLFTWNFMGASFLTFNSPFTTTGYVY